jgi:hypothetical protein
VTDSMKLVFLVFWFCLVALHGDVQSSDVCFEEGHLVLSFWFGGYSPGKSRMLCWHCYYCLLIGCRV